MPMWDMHNRTTPEQARINRGRSNDGKIPAVEDTAASDDGNDVSLGVESGGVVRDVARPTPAQAGLVSVVTGAMTGAFAVWLGHEKDGGNGTNVRRVGRPDPDN